MTSNFGVVPLSGSLVMAALFAAAPVTRGTDRQTARAETQISAPEKAPFAFTSESGPMAVSHDGKRLAFIATFAGTNMIWVRSLDSDAAQRIVGTDGAHYPFWSPDDRFLGFFADGKLKKIAVSGGTAQTLCDAPQPRGGTWNADNTIVFAPGAHDPLSRISSAGGKPVAITRLDEKADEYSHRFPWFLQDGHHFLYLSQSSKGFSDSRIYVGSLDSDEKAPMISANSPAMSSFEGYFFFLRGRTLMAQRFDAKELRVLGESRPVADDIQYFPNTASAMFAVADDGTLAFHRGPGRMSRMVWVDRSGKEVGSSHVSGNTQLPRISHRADRIVYSLADPVSGEGDLWILDVARDVSTRFTSERGDEVWAVWSRDDAQIAYSGGPHGSYDIFVKPSSGKDLATVLYSSSATKFVNDWSSDGRYILFQQIEHQPKAVWEIWVLNVATKTAAPLIQTQFNDEGAAFSPDGKWIAYASDATGRKELYIQPFPGPGAARQISTNGGSEPQWTDDGKQIYFRDGSDAMSRVDVETTSEVRACQPVMLFSLRARWLNIGGRQWQVASDRERVLEDVLIPEVVPAPITILTNWSK